MNPYQANELIKKHGAKELSKNASGREILKKAAEPHRIDLLQPGQPGFEAHWGKAVKANKLAREQNEQKSKDMWAESKDRREWEERHK